MPSASSKDKSSALKEKKKSKRSRSGRESSSGPSSALAGGVVPSVAAVASSLLPSVIGANGADSSSSSSSKASKGPRLLLRGQEWFGRARSFVSESRHSPSTRRRLALYLWAFVVFYTILSIMGVGLPQPMRSGLVRGSKAASGSGGGLDDADAYADAEGGGGEFKFNTEGATGPAGGDGEGGDGDGEMEEDLKQVLPSKNKKRFDKRTERSLGCQELECIAACNAKGKPKCLKSKSCRETRDKICHKRCRKARCEERCKDEPKLGYVEREQKMEGCKEKCTGNTAVVSFCSCSRRILGPLYGAPRDGHTGLRLYATPPHTHTPTHPHTHLHPNHNLGSAQEHLNSHTAQQVRQKVPLGKQAVQDALF